MHKKSKIVDNPIGKKQTAYQVPVKYAIHKLYPMVETEDDLNNTRFAITFEQIFIPKKHSIAIYLLGFILIFPIILIPIRNHYLRVSMKEFEFMKHILKTYLKSIDVINDDIIHPSAQHSAKHNYTEISQKQIQKDQLGFINERFMRATDCVIQNNRHARIAHTWIIGSALLSATMISLALSAMLALLFTRTLFKFYGGIKTFSQAEKKLILYCVLSASMMIALITLIASAYLGIRKAKFEHFKSGNEPDYFYQCDWSQDLPLVTMTGYYKRGNTPGDEEIHRDAIIYSIPGQCSVTYTYGHQLEEDNQFSCYALYGTETTAPKKLERQIFQLRASHMNLKYVLKVIE